MLTNSVGAQPIIFRSGIGTGLVVMAIMVVDQSVPVVVFTIRVRIIVLRTKIMLTNTAGIYTSRTPKAIKLFRTGIGKGRVVMAIMIVVENVPMLDSRPGAVMCNCFVLGTLILFINPWQILLLPYL